MIRVIFIHTSVNMPRIYECVREEAHVRMRPDMYLGSIDLISVPKATIYDPETNTLRKRDVTYSGGLLSIFDELFMNALDNINQTPPVKNIHVTIRDDMMSIYNDGCGIPIERRDGIYLPEMLFTKFRSGSNFGESKTTGGKNGIGCKVATVFSSETILSITHKGKLYVQLINYEDMMADKVKPPTISDAAHKDGSVEVIMYPDFENLHKKLGVDSITDDTKFMIYKRIYDMTHLNINFKINDISIPRITWDEYVKSFDVIEGDVYTYSSNGWMVSFGLSATKYNLSFVNNIHTSKNGSHVTDIRNQLTSAVSKAASRDIELKNTIINSKLAVFVYAIIEDPIFSSQGKEKCTLRVLSPKCILPLPLIKSFIVESDIINILTTKAVTKPKATGRKKFVNVDGALDATNAKLRNGSCTLFICEGLSARSMCVNGISVLKNQNLYGCFPLGGKVLNVRGATTSKYLANKVLTGLKNLIGLTDGMEYTNTNKLRYGKIVCVKDADSDGASIMGLVINFFSVKFRSLLNIPGFFNEFITPMIKVVLSKRVHDFYNEVDYRNFIYSLPSRNNMKVNFIKGLGAISPTDAKTYFGNYNNHCININFSESAWASLTKAFEQGKVYTDGRKEWIRSASTELVLRRESGKPIECVDFIDHDLVNYSYDACVRSIPSVIDGLKPTPRKILYTLFRMKNKGLEFTKVFQLGGNVSNAAYYHHGDQSMNGTIIGMLNDYPGSNNIPLLKYEGQPGSRMENGDDAAAPRYLSTALSPVARLIFPEEDDCLLEHTIVDGYEAEYNHFIPIIPFVLCNGVLGIGTGWSTEIPAFNPIELIQHVRSTLTETKFHPIHSYYRGFKGLITDDRVWQYHPIIEIKDKTVHITEIPVGVATSKVIGIINKYLLEEGKNNEFPIIDYSRKGDSNEIDITLKFTRVMTKEEIIKQLGLQRSISKTNMVLFNPSGVITRYPKIGDIIDDWFCERLKYYMLRKEHQLKSLNNLILLESNRARFIKLILEKKLNINNQPLVKVVEQLDAFKFDKIDDTYNYLTHTMTMVFLTKEKYNELCEKLKSLEVKRDELIETSEASVWLRELEILEKYLTQQM